MEGSEIKTSWLVKRLAVDDEQWAHAIAPLLPQMKSDDELWLFDEPAA